MINVSLYIIFKTNWTWKNWTVSFLNSLVFYFFCQTSPLLTQTRSLLIKRRWWRKREGVWRSNGGQGYAWSLMDRGCEGRRADAILVNVGITGWNCDTAGRSSNGQRLLRVPGRGQHQRALPLLAVSGRAGKKGLGREGKGRGGKGRDEEMERKTAESNRGTCTCMGTGVSLGSFTW